MAEFMHHDLLSSGKSLVAAAAKWYQSAESYMTCWVMILLRHAYASNVVIIRLESYHA